MKVLWWYTAVDSLNEHLYRINISMKQTPGVGPSFVYSLNVTFYKTDISNMNT